jgi:hypothetical protein
MSKALEQRVTAVELQQVAMKRCAEDGHRWRTGTLNGAGTLGLFSFRNGMTVTRKCDVCGIAQSGNFYFYNNDNRNEQAAKWEALKLFLTAK